MKLTKEQEALLATEFPAEIEKQAAEEVAKVQELYSVGFEKMAAEAAEAMDKEEEEKEEEKEDKKELSEDQKKEASARAAFIARGYIDGLMKEGSERHGEELHYLIPAIAEKLAMDAGKVKAFLSNMGGKAKDMANKAAPKAKEMANKAKEHVKANKGAYGAGAAGAGAGYLAGRSGKKEK